MVDVEKKGEGSELMNPHLPVKFLTPNFNSYFCLVFFPDIHI